ncbi:DUF2235 domain-containing protein [Burkholderia thailandensis]|uniref:DUF2235 domain-containing protein n=1 Tax=Burkholderia thailandensis TaxID=57975 RepID=UPI0021B32C18|nr:DUF2235 domain-containing protein [Burkholderia thailandensis]
MFGFSRGAAEARTFSNWLVDALESDFSLCGVPVSYDFLGIFDTVASVGIAQSAAATLFDGHGGWARKELMAVPHYVRRCVHMVAAHEPRGSFPLDLIDCSLEGREEIVYPGVHSDVVVVTDQPSRDEDEAMPISCRKFHSLTCIEQHVSPAYRSIYKDLASRRKWPMHLRSPLDSSKPLLPMSRQVRATIREGAWDSGLMRAHYGCICAGAGCVSRI